MQERIVMSVNGLTHEIGPEDPEVRAWHESLVADEYARCRPGDTFADLKRRARFSKEDQGHLKLWMARAAKLAETMRKPDRAAA